MPQSRHPLIEARRDQMFAVLLDLSDRATPHNGPIPRFY